MNLPFWQLKAAFLLLFSHPMVSLYIGIDVGKFHHVACFLDDRGNQIELLKFGNNHQRLVSLRSSSKDFLLQMMDSFWGWRQLAITGFPCMILIDKEYQVKVFNPLKVNWFRDFYIQPVKTDVKDAFVIANILRYEKERATSLAPPNVQRLQRPVRYRRFLCDRLTQVKNKIRCLLDKVFPEYQNSRIFSCFFGKASRALLKIVPTPGKILSLPVKEWAIYLEAHSRKLG